MVAVFVDRSGKVVDAIPGDRIPGGLSSNTADACLLRIAREAALKTRWQGDPDAPEKQKGYIVYNFKKNL